MLPVNGDLDFKNNAGILNLAPAIQNGQPIIFEQFNTSLSNKADLINGVVPSSQLPTIYSNNSISFAINPTPIVGTIPTIVGSLFLEAGSYSLSADFGCGIPTDTAILEIKLSDGTVIATLESLGGLSWYTYPTTLQINSSVEVDILLSANSESAVSFIRGLKL